MENIAQNDFNILEDNEEVEKDKYLTVVVADEYYALNINNVVEIVGTVPITKVPDYPEFAIGVINLRGEIIPIIDLKPIFKKENREFDEKTCFVIVELDGSRYGFVVDYVIEVTDFGDEPVMDPPEIANGDINRVTIAMGKIGDDLYLIIDPKSVIQ